MHPDCVSQLTAGGDAAIKQAAATQRQLNTALGDTARAPRGLLEPNCERLVPYLDWRTPWDS